MHFSPPHRHSLAIKPLILSALVGIVMANPALADSLKLTETRNDKLACETDPDTQEKICSVVTSGKYSATLNLSADTIGAASTAFPNDFAGMLTDAEANSALPIAVSIGGFSFDGDVIDDEKATLTATNARATWIDSHAVCIDPDCAESKDVTDTKLVLNAGVRKGVTLTLTGSNRTADAEGWGSNLFQELCVDAGPKPASISVTVGDALISKDITVKCVVNTRTDNDGNELTSQKISAKLAAPSCTN
jgi:hypothetical protein